MGLTFRYEDASWSSLSTCESSLTVGMLCRSQSCCEGDVKFAHASLISSSSEEFFILKRAYLNNQKAFCHASKEWSVYLCQFFRIVKFGMINFWRWVFGFFLRSWVCKIHPETAKYTQNRSWDMYICIYILICSLFNELAISETDGGERKYIPFDYTYSQSVQSVSQSTLRA